MALSHPLPFGALLKRERLARGLTQEALAERAGLSTRAISDLERGVNRAPRKETLRLLADALQLAAEERAHLEAAYHWSTAAPTMPAAPEHWLASDSTRVPLAGRAPELARLAQHLAGEGPPLLLLAGEPGIGKSRLLEEAAARASRQGWMVLAGGCHRQSGQEPYTPLLGALADYLRRQPLARGRSALEGCAWLVRLLPELAEQGLLPSTPWKLPPEQERRLMFAAVERLLSKVAGPAGTLLVLDDLQWAGADALELLAVLVRTTGQTALRVLGSYRSTDVRPEEPLAALLADLAAAGLAAQRDLSPGAYAGPRILYPGARHPQSPGRTPLCSTDRGGAGSTDPGIAPVQLLCCRGAARDGGATQQAPVLTQTTQTTQTGGEHATQYNMLPGSTTSTGGGRAGASRSDHFTP